MAVERQLRDTVAGFGGFENVRMEPIPVTFWDANFSRLEVINSLSDVVFAPEIQAVPYAAFTPAEGLSAPLLFVDPESLPPAEVWKNAIVVTEVRFPQIDTKQLLKLSMGRYDPDNNLAEVNHPATWIRLGWHVYREAVRRGAAGFVGILTNQPGGSCRMFAPYGFREEDILDKPIPGAWVGREEGKRLKLLAQSGQHRAKLTITGERFPSQTHNIVAELPGRDRDDEIIVLHSHHDSPFRSPVEDASGCAVVLALAEQFARERSLSRRLVVLITAGHFYGSIGTRTFIHDHPEIVTRTAVELSIEHIALEAVENEAGELIPTGRPEPSALFCSFSPTLVQTAIDAMAAHEVDRSIVLPAEGPLGNYPPTDGGDWYHAGVPVINCISNPVYLLTDDDDDCWVDRPRLAKMAAAFDQIIRRLDVTPRQKFKTAPQWLGRKLAMKLLAKLVRAKATHFGRREIY